MPTITRDKLTLSSGREIDVVSGIIGLYVDGGPSDYGWDARAFYSGHDDSHPTNYPEGIFGGPPETWTHDERRELAEFMVAQWMAWMTRCNV